MKIFGHTNQINQLVESSQNGSLPQALLFCGPEGVGKSLVAIELIRQQLCLESGQTDCACRSCHLFAKQSHPDFLKITKGESSQILKDDVVEGLRSFLNMPPFMSPKKAILIDQAEVLNSNSQNALLKTLEEPPAYAQLFLVTARQSALLDTILSRCRIVEFAEISNQELDAFLADKQCDDKHLALLKFVFGGRIGRISYYLDNPELLQDWIQLITTLAKLAQKGADERLSWVKQQKIGSPEDLQTVVYYLRRLWAQAMTMSATSQKEEFLPDLGFFDKVAKELSVLQTAAFLQYLTDTEQRIKAGLNYELQLDNILLTMPQVSD